MDDAIRQEIAGYLGMGIDPNGIFGTGVTHEDAREALAAFPAEYTNRVRMRRRFGLGEETDPVNWPARDDGMPYEHREINDFRAAGLTMFTAPNPRGVSVGIPNRDSDSVDREEPAEEGRANLIDLDRAPPLYARNTQNPETGMITLQAERHGAAGPQINQIHDGPAPDAADQYHQANNEGLLGGEL